jgi:hypothetical protein
MAVRDLRVDMQAIIDARQRSPEDPTEPYLDLKTGEVLLSMDEDITGEPDEVQALLAEDPDRLELIVREDSHEGWARMRDFADAVDDDDVRSDLQRALEGQGAFRRFRAAVARDPDLQAQWRAYEWDGLAREGEEWLKRRLEIRAIYDRPAWMQAVAMPAPKTAESALTILDVLLLGAPDGKTELIDGKVRRRVPARDPAHARKLFKLLARDLAQLNGREWRKRFIEGQSSYEIDRYKLIQTDDGVQLEIAISPDLWRLFV